jgi:hypothetical protein
MCIVMGVTCLLISATSLWVVARSDVPRPPRQSEDPASASWQEFASKARALPREGLEQDITITYGEVLQEYNQTLAAKLDAYLYVYNERYPESQWGSSLQIEILNKFGPCFGIPEGHCRE